MTTPSAENTAGTTRHLLLHWAEAQLEEAGITSARRNAEWMLSEVLACGRAMLYAFPEASVGPAEVARVQTMVARRLQREPLQYVLGHTEFYGLPIQVTPSVLIPRPETEQVVEAALRLLEDHPAPAVLDVGTGSGCIALAVKHERPAAAVTACDVSVEALDVARANAGANGLDVTFVEADVLDPGSVRQLPHQLQLVVSNPPYVPDEEAEALEAEVRDHEPHTALFSGPDPLCFYRAIGRRAQELLAPDGFLVFEVHADYGRAVGQLLKQQGYGAVHVEQDLSGRDRIVRGRHST